MNPSFMPILSERNALWIPAYAGMTDWFVSNSPSFEGVARSDGVVAARQRATPPVGRTPKELPRPLGTPSNEGEFSAFGIRSPL
jgi:hypothetical protein